MLWILQRHCHKWFVHCQSWCSWWLQTNISTWKLVKYSCLSAPWYCIRSLHKKCVFGSIQSQQKLYLCRIVHCKYPAMLMCNCSTCTSSTNNLVTYFSSTTDHHPYYISKHSVFLILRDFALLLSIISAVGASKLILSKICRATLKMLISRNPSGRTLEFRSNAEFTMVLFSLRLMVWITLWGTLL